MTKQNTIENLNTFFFSFLSVECCELNISNRAHKRRALSPMSKNRTKFRGKITEYILSKKQLLLPTRIIGQLYFRPVDHWPEDLSD